LSESSDGVWIVTVRSPAGTSVNANRPSESVTLCSVVPCTSMRAARTGLPDSESMTVPRIDCAPAVAVKSDATIAMATESRTLTPASAVAV
jgi:hypothetical protein